MIPLRPYTTNEINTVTRAGIFAVSEIAPRTSPADRAKDWTRRSTESVIEGMASKAVRVNCIEFLVAASEIAESVSEAVRTTPCNRKAESEMALRASEAVLVKLCAPRVATSESADIVSEAVRVNACEFRVAES